MNLKDLAVIKDQLPVENKKPPVINKNKGKITFDLGVTDHALERYYQRYLNNTHYDTDVIRTYVKDKIKEEGILGCRDRVKDVEYVAIHKEGLFVKNGAALVTFVSIDKFNREYMAVYRKLCEKRGVL